MSNGGQLNKKALRSRGIPVSSKEKLSHLVKGLAGMVSAVDQSPEVTAVTCSNMAEYLLNSVGYKLTRRVETQKETDNGSESSSDKT